MLAHPIVDCRYAKLSPLARFAHLWDALLPYWTWRVTVGAKLLVQPGQALFERRAECLDAFAVNPASPMIGFDALPRDLQVLPLVHLVDERVYLPRPRRIDPVRESPRPMVFG